MPYRWANWLTVSGIEAYTLTGLLAAKRAGTIYHDMTLDESDRNSRSYESFLRQACRLYELDWRKYRRRGARRMLRDHLMSVGIPGYEAYLEILRTDPEEASRLPDRMRITVSRFFRERDRWLQLAEQVIPRILSENKDRRLFRAWSAGCCCGEEPYSLSLLWLDSIRPGFPAFDMEILATDIDPEVLERAEDGCYDKASLREIPEPMLRDYFDRPQKRWCVRPRVREYVSFRINNLMTEPLPEGMDLVLCRYLVFTYYRGDRRYRAAERLWRALRPGGALMIGRKEGLGPKEMELFAPWPGAEGVFSKRSSGKS